MIHYLVLLEWNIYRVYTDPKNFNHRKSIDFVGDDDDHRFDQEGQIGVASEK